MSISLRETLGAVRALAVYRPTRAHTGRLMALYADVVPKGGLAFDIGAHAGDRIAAFRGLGARVVAVEPQPAMARLLRWRFGRDGDVTLHAVAMGAVAGRAELAVNTANPSVSTLSDRFRAAADGAQGWEGQVWDRRIEVEVRTLDSLIADHGVPDFIKIDVEGFEAEVLAGLSRPVPALSFEVVFAARDLGMAALDRAQALGYDAFRFSQGESHRFEADWCDGTAMARFLRDAPERLNSGDVYARRTIPDRSDGARDDARVGQTKRRA